MGTNITGIGNANAIGFKSRVTGGIYFPPELKDALVGVWLAYGKSNDSTDRNIIKNKIKDRGGDFVISNAAFKLNSGFGKYETDFTTWIQTNGVIASSDKVQNSIVGRFLYFNSVNKKEDVPSFKVNITLGQQSKLQYNYIKEDGTSTYIVYSESGIYTIPASYFSKYTGGDAWFGFYQIEGTSIIEQIPSFEGAFVTDGIDDLITSTKTVQEMGVTDEITIVSMIHQIQLNPSSSITNDIRVSSNNTSGSNGQIVVSAKNKTGIYGWSRKGNTKVIITKILGDENDYSLTGENSTNYNNKFSVVGTVDNRYNSSVAWYWTIIANKVLTTDQINQVIAYFNLDRCVEPTVLYDVKRQGLSNDTPDSDWYLKDFSKNGFDMSLFNFAKKGNSGVGKYNFSSIDVLPNRFEGTVTSNKCHFTKKLTSTNDFCDVQVISPNEPIKFKVSGLSDGRKLFFLNKDGSGSNYHFDNGEHEVSLSFSEGVGQNNPFGVTGDIGDIDVTVEFIPSHAGALCLDGVNDFGKVTGMPIYEDYTIVVDYERISGIEQAWAEALISKSYIANQGAFVLMETNGTAKHSYSFGAYTTFNKDDSTRTLLYQSKYKCGDVNLNAGTGIDGDTLWLGTYRDNYSSFFNGVIYSLMSFPYSMSEFLIERQLKKYKLGTLYPNMVEFRPVIKSNASYDNIVFYYKNEKVENGTYLTVGSSIGMHIRLSSNPVNEIKSITVNGIPATFKFHDANNNIYQYDFNLTSKSLQKINITIDEYIRYEDIVQPYPILLRFNDENGNEVSWGGKFKVGSTITRIGSMADPESNLLSGLYSISGLSLNGKAVTSSTSIVEKQMVFRTTATWLLDNNEPKVILSPSRLRIPNSSYKLLGYIPDISGHGNHGVIHNSAYAEGSGVNEDGSYQLDGVDDFVTIPTIAGKQVLIKLNWQNKAIGNLIYDQRDYGNTSFAIMPVNISDTTNNRIAYQARNANGITYIDGIRNEYIESYSLENIIHNITITNPDVSNRTVVLGASNRTTADYFAKYALYDFMLFDEISTDDKIKELNEYVGIEAKVELPPYYWDTYGKTNSDADRDTIQQRGVAVGDYDLTNTNFAYDKMSGFSGYEFEKFTDTTKWIEIKREDGIEIIEKNDYSFTAKKVGTGQYFWDFKNNGIKTLDRDLTVKAVSNNNVSIRWEFKYRTAEKPDTDSTIVLVKQAMTPNVPITVTLPYKTQEEQTELGVVEGSAYYLFYFDPSDIPVGDEYTVEILPLYTNGLVYDGITDYSKNANIPALDDFTAIIKREWLKKQGCPLIKGSKVYEGGNGNALLFEWDKAYNFVFYKRTDIMEGEVPENISFITPTNYNGNVITRGSGQDTNGICIAGDGNAGFANIVFYKLILYPKTISLLQINFLKNLMERDEIIDLNNPIFIKK